MVLRIAAEMNTMIQNIILYDRIPENKGRFGGAWHPSHFFGVEPL
jgi:hypothetical protein